MNAGNWQSKPVKTILAPIDFSSITELVINQARTLARAFDGRVVLLHVMQPPVITSEYSPFIENIAEIVTVGEKAAAKQLAQLQERLMAEGIATETLQFTGAPVGNILTQAAKLAADYIVMGSHGHKAVYDLIVGSTTHGVLLRATCPVIIVPAQKPKAPAAK